MPQNPRGGNPGLVMLHCRVMQYFLGLHITGDAGAYLHELTKSISEHFGTWALHERVPPHITLFRPFDADDAQLQSVIETVQQWLAAQPMHGFTISGFDRFDDKVVFADVQADPALVSRVEHLQRRLERLPQMPDERPHWHPHASIARLLPPEQIERIWEYVTQLEDFAFTVPLENVTVFHHPEQGRWRPLQVIDTQ